MRYRLWLRVLQIAGTFLLAGVLLTRIEWNEIAVLAADFQWAWLIFGCLLVGVSHLVNVGRWRYLLQFPAVSRLRLVTCYGAGLFSNSFLPTGVGGDAVRATMLSRDTGWTRAILSVGLDRSIGLMSFSVLFVIGIWLGVPPGGSINALFSGLRTALTVIPIGLTLAALVFVLMWQVWAGLRWYMLTLRARVSDYGQGWTFRRWALIGGGAYLLAVLSSLLLVVVQYAMFEALNLVVPFSAAVWGMFFGSLSLLLPIALNGLGVMESVYVLVLGSYGLSATTALAAALLIRAMMLFYSLLGGLLTLHV